MILGKETQDWIDIYSLLNFRGSNPKSLKDLLEWIPPQTPQECLKIGMELCEARAQKYENPVPEWLKNFLLNNKI